MNYFVEGYEDLHNDEKQMLSQDRSLGVEINLEPVLDENGEMIDLE